MCSKRDLILVCQRNMKHAVRRMKQIYRQEDELQNVLLNGGGVRSKTLLQHATAGVQHNRKWAMCIHTYLYVPMIHTLYDTSSLIYVRAYPTSWRIHKGIQDTQGNNSCLPSIEEDISFSILLLTDTKMREKIFHVDYYVGFISMVAHRDPSDLHMHANNLQPSWSVQQSSRKNPANKYY